MLEDNGWSENLNSKADNPDDTVAQQKHQLHKEFWYNYKGFIFSACSTSRKMLHYQEKMANPWNRVNRNLNPEMITNSTC